MVYGKKSDGKKYVPSNRKYVLHVYDLNHINHGKRRAEVAPLNSTKRKSPTRLHDVAPPTLSLAISSLVISVNAACVEGDGLFFYTEKGPIKIGA